MTTEWIKSIEIALDQVGGDPVSPSVTAMISAILVAKGIVTASELQEIEYHYNNKR